MLKIEIREQIKLFLTALMFLTRVPCPKWIGYSEEQLNSSCRYFPLIGTFVGASGAIAWWLADFLWPPSVATLLAMITTIIITGAFHEDGFSDTCDGFGGGWNRSQILTIMKDSRVGAYGVIGIIFALGLKFALLEALPDHMIVASLIIAHTVSRFLAISFIFTHDYARDDDTSKIRPLAYRIRRIDFWFGIATTALTLMLLPLYTIIPIIIATLIVYIIASKVLLAPLAGYTGDTLGAIQQMSELVVYLVILAVVG